MGNWHSRPMEKLWEELRSSPAGLSETQARARLERWGPNELERPPRPGLLRRALALMKDPMLLVLLGAAGVSLAASRGRDWLDAAIILVIVAVNNLLSLSQEDHAQRALEALRRGSAPMARALREGRQVRLEAEKLVPGDVIVLRAGDLVPADCRIFRGSGVMCDESALTGESAGAAKTALELLPKSTPVGEQTNMVLAGTLLTAGGCSALVCATGMDTEMGRIARLLLESPPQPTPLQKRMAEVSRVLSFLCVCICAVMFGVGLLQGRDMLEMFLTAVSLAVAAIPEGLAATVTIVLTLGVQRMAGRGAIVKKLTAVETLGCAGVICSDKTGTLTQNKMTVQKLWIPAGGHRREALVAGCLCSDAVLEWRSGAPAAAGDPTECALVVEAAREGLDQRKLGEEMPRLGELPFDSARKLMSTFHRRGGAALMLVKGAPDVLLSRCDRGPKGPLTAADRAKILQANEAMAGEAMRVIAVASRALEHTPAHAAPEELEQGLTFLGLFGLADPPRPEAAAAVALCHRAGIRPVMITGDHRSTALAIARQLGIFRAGDLAVTGAELDFMPQSVLEEDIQKFSVFARVTPEHKMRIVRAWQKRGQVVAMTGDGVNDAPALKAADIGCAMGLGGTDAAKGAAEMILTDDNFSTIVRAVEEGRGIYANIRKAIHYLLSCNIGEILTVFTATVLGMGQLPLAPVQLLWLNLVTDSLPALALGVEPAEENSMDRPPRDPSRGLFDREFSLRLLRQGVMVGGLTMCAYLLGLRESPAAAGTMAFGTLTLSQLFHAYNVRSEERSLLSLGFFGNPAMNRAFLTGLGLQLAVMLLPPLQGVFSVTPMSMGQWGTVSLLALAPIPICEAGKALRRGRRAAGSEKPLIREYARTGK